MNYDRLENIDLKKAERFRLAAYLFFFLCLGTLLLGVVPAMYYGSGWWVLATILAAGAFFFLAFFAGGIGWSRLRSGETTSVAGRQISRREQRTEPYETQGPIAPPPEESNKPYAPPTPSDQSRPPIE
jgi:fatty acid desaturase